MARITGVSTPFGGLSWEYKDDDSNAAIMYIIVLLESKRLLTMPWSRTTCHLPFESDVEYCIQSALSLKARIPLVLSSHKVSPFVMLAVNEIVHVLNDFLDNVALVQNPPIIIDQSTQQRKFQEMVKQLKERIAHTMEPLLRNAFPHESLFDMLRIATVHTTLDCSDIP